MLNFADFLSYLSYISSLSASNTYTSPLSPYKIIISSKFHIYRKHWELFFTRKSENMFKIGLRSNCISRAFLTKSSIRKFSTRKLEGKIALITGAASGIGKETAKKFINNGAKVVIADIQTKLGQETATELGTSHASFISCDVSKESDIAHAVDYAVSNYGQLDIMFNNAGIACHTPPTIVDLDLAAFDRVMSINVRGVVAGIKHASRVMIPQGRGSILCTSSITGVLGGLAQHTYSISKSTVVGIMKSAAAELCRYGIRINCISPFAIPTPFVIEEMRVYFPGVDDQGLAKMIHDNGVLKGTICEPEDIANAALYLASDDAKYVSGHNLVVDGGFTSIKNLSFPVSNEFKSEE
ncbi:short-chain dehydrogenase reductase 3a-like isoform X1 [Olea europaea var. sylvestris]|uniref:short-chain dehydrogenase reductase 3a-like isoform X1 n=1 Tax=Olea europaea var. sylvestris TaxID=158386 RepID=UPI000C1D3304|nr:short-chain dehydrogenase reductase 3a-like isoform X1 [Olea europaea var. sylvestris]